MPRVLIAGFCAVPGPDRAGVQLGHVIRALSRNHTVDVLAVRRGDQAYVEKVQSARILRVPVPDGAIRSRIDAFRRALRRQLEGADYDVVHFRDGWSGVPVLEMQGRLRYAAVYDAGRSPLGEPQVYDHETATALERDELECARRADLILTATEPLRLYFSQLVPPERVRLVPPGVDVDSFDWDEPPSGPPRILLSGALTPGRGVRVLLRAMLDVASHSDARLALAGRSTPEFFASLENAVRDLGLRERVELLGEVPHDEVPRLIASATVCVAPGAIEIAAKPFALYPTKLLEYMACQRAVVAPRRGTVTMLLRDEQHGLLFEPGQPLDLAQKIMRLLGDPELRGRIARGGYELVRRVHTASSTRREVRRAYGWLASISPWRERFAAMLEEMPTGDMPPLAAPEPTGPSGWGHARAAAGVRPIAAFEAEALVDDVTESSQVGVDTGLTEGFGEVTKVEAPPVGEEDRPAYQPLSTAMSVGPPADEWVVEDSRIRSLVALPDRGETRSTSTPIDARFVAGELEVPSPSERTNTDPVVSLEDGAFTAMAPMLGLRPEEGGEPVTTTNYPLLEESTLMTAKTAIVQREPRPAPPTLPPLVPVARPAANAAPESDTPKVVVGNELRVGTGDDTGP
ncbi:MAG TPA: glycosyltransferase family 4 protein [Kofleriaceae bacterium]|nr:glycosyltransferase family 4 protein [Kofleriaceae bacterium]